MAGTESREKKASTSPRERKVRRRGEKSSLPFSLYQSLLPFHPPVGRKRESFLTMPPSGSSSPFSFQKEMAFFTDTAIKRIAQGMKRKEKA